tara:strand:- start:522 stop:863 length:342 start_codon:yes stop_codon:yes gene_type:complete
MNAYNPMNKHFDRNECGQLITPDLADFIAEFTGQGSFTTPEGTVEANHLLEHLDFSDLQIAHDSIQMEALGSGRHTTIGEAAKNWFMLCNLMNLAAKPFYEKNIVPDYQNGDV